MFQVTMSISELVALWIGVSFTLALPTLAFSHGASPASCLEMSPGHIRTHPQDPHRSHVTLYTSTSTYLPGDLVTVTVRSTRDFMGFLLQARSLGVFRGVARGRGGSASVAGTWTLTPPGTHTLRCHNDHDSLTHSDKQLKRNLSFVWKAPDTAIGDLRFYITVVQSYFVYWARVESAVMHDGSRSLPGWVNATMVVGGRAHSGLQGNGPTVTNPAASSLATSMLLAKEMEGRRKDEEKQDGWMEDEGLADQKMMAGWRTRQAMENEQKKLPEASSGPISRPHAASPVTRWFSITTTMEPLIKPWSRSGHMASPTISQQAPETQTVTNPLPQPPDPTLAITNTILSVEFLTVSLKTSPMTGNQTPGQHKLQPAPNLMQPEPQSPIQDLTQAKSKPSPEQLFISDLTLAPTSKKHLTNLQPNSQLLTFTRQSATPVPDQIPLNQSLGPHPSPKTLPRPPEREGKIPNIIPSQSAWELGIVLGCAAGLGMALTLVFRYLCSQHCRKHTGVTLNDRERDYDHDHQRHHREGLIHVQECGDLVRVRRIRDNSFVLLAEYNMLTPPGN
ncbi:hypothetical protein UPYG_G00244200 [Umbra pygmaea]|uniref:Reelin domain-containing protein n=1 Tax=Umbra pygmaea TaxID=75934 RepID=A0ABD0WKT7_UMBPY